MKLLLINIPVVYRLQLNLESNNIAQEKHSKNYVM